MRRRPEPVRRCQPADGRTIRPALVGPAQGGEFHHPHGDDQGGGNAGDAAAAGDIPGGRWARGLSGAAGAAGQDRRTNRCADGDADNSATYILQRPGDYVLPAIDVRWWNAGEGRVETAHLDAVTMQVAANPAVQPAGASAPKARLNWTAIVDLIADHWLFALLATLVVAGLIRVAPGAVRRIAAYHRRRRQAYRAIRGLCLQPISPCGPAPRRKAAYFAMLDWLPHVGATTPDHTVEAFKVAAGDPCWTARSTRSKPSCLRHNATQAVGRDVNCCTA